MEVTINLIAFVGALVAFGVLLVVMIFCLSRIRSQLAEMQACLDSIVILMAKDIGMPIMMNGEEIEDISPLIFGEQDSEEQEAKK